MEAAKKMGVEPVISPQEMASTDVDHLGVMAYVAWFQNCNRKMTPKRQISHPAETIQRKMSLSKQIVFSKIATESQVGAAVSFLHK